jgi:hypothetical protein
MTIQDIRDQHCLLFECLSGSRAYGLSLPGSDTDIRGVFVLPKKQFYGLEYVEQVSSDKNDETYFELRRFAELLTKNNPNILEMLGASLAHILYKHPLFDLFTIEMVLSKLCKGTFAGYAFSQIKKAKGLNKKIHNPEEPARKTPLHFCYVVEKQGSVPLLKWLEIKKIRQEDCGLVVIPNIRDLYGLYHDAGGALGFKGILQKENANEVALSSVPKGCEPVAVMSFNKDGYAKHCKDYRDYWDWVAVRNQERYQNTLQHGKNYDTKNMMHTFRLLDMAAEILEFGKIVVERPNREELLAIRRGDFFYEELLEKAEQKLQRIEALHTISTLPEMPDKGRIEAILVEIREAFYKEG